MNDYNNYLCAYILQYSQEWNISKKRFKMYCMVCKTWKHALHRICNANYKVFQEIYFKVILKSSERFSCFYWFKEFFFKPRRQLYFTLKGTEDQEEIVTYLKKYFSKVQAHEVKSVTTSEYYQIICWLPKPISFYHFNR